LEFRGRLTKAQLSLSVSSLADRGFNVTPILSNENESNCGTANTISGCQLAMRNSAKSVKPLYFDDLGFGKFVASRSLAARAVSFFAHVLAVVFWGSKPKVTRIHAIHNVSTGAIVADKVTIRHRTKVQNPTGNMSENVPAASLSPSDEAVASDSCGCRPNPTPVRFLDFVPKAFGERGRKPLRSQVFRGNLWLHNQFLWLCRALGCFYNAEAFSF